MSNFINFRFFFNMASVAARLNVFNIIRRERRLPRPLVFRDRTNPLEDMEPEEVFEIYRFKPETIPFLVEILHADLARPTRRNSALTPLIQILVALRFLATGSFYILVGEPLGIAKSTAVRAVRHVCFLLARLAQKYISFPADLSSFTCKSRFFEIAGKLINNLHIALRIFSVNVYYVYLKIPTCIRINYVHILI